MIKKALSIFVVVACFYGLVFSESAGSFRSLISGGQSKIYKATELESLAHLAAVLNDLDPNIFKAQIRQESNFNQFARSPVGAIGVAQIMSGTAKGWKVDPHDPVQSLDAAARHMKSYVRTYKKQGHDENTAYKMALAAYNAGPGAVSKYGDVPPYAETRNYVKRIMQSK